MTDPDQIIRAKDAARLLGISPPVLKSRIKAGLIAGWKDSRGHFWTTHANALASLVEVQPAAKLATGGETRKQTVAAMDAAEKRKPVRFGRRNKRK